MYMHYWGLQKNPFDSVPDPGMYFHAHSTVESTVAELLFAIEEGNECLAVVVGEVGLGKTMALRVVLNELKPESYRVAYVTNPDITFVQLMREIIGQLREEPCTIRDKEGLLEELNRILFETADSGRKVLVFIDEGNAMKGANLEALRLLTNMQEDTRNLLTLIIAGQPKLGRMLEDPRRANLFQRVGVYARLEPLDSVGLVRQYVEHRLQRAGAQGPIFDNTAFEAIFEHSSGVPRLINRVCKLSLKAGETNGLSIISGEVVKDIATRFEPSSRKTARKATDETARPAPIPVVVPQASAEAHTRREGHSVAGVREVTEASKPDEVVARDYQLIEAAKAEVFVANRSRRSEVPDENGNNGFHRHGAVSLKVKEEETDSPGEQLAIPREVIEVLRNLRDERQRLRLAGQLAARQIQEHPERYTHAIVDPVQAWDQLRSEILRKVG